MPGQRYSFRELVDIHFVYGLANGNQDLARRLYHQRHPDRRLPAPRTFARIHQRLGESGAFYTQNNDAGRNRDQRIVEIEEEVLDQVAENPSTSSRIVASNLPVSHMTVWRIWKENLLYPYHIQRVQGLHPRDFPLRMQFARWFLNMCGANPQFPAIVLFTDEANFSREAITNFHNNHVWNDINPHAITEGRHQQTFSLNVWGGIIGDDLLGPVFLPPILNGENYLEFLEYQLPELLNLNLRLENNHYFMHDGAPAHFRLTVRNYLDETYPNRWIGRGGPVPWPPRSPDCNPCDFYLWGHVKSLVYERDIPNLEVLRDQIINAFETIRRRPGILRSVRGSMVRRMEACIAANGAHFEHFL